MRVTLTGRRCIRVAVALAIGAFSASAPAAAQAPVALATIRGIATDSVRGGRLEGAYIELIPSGRQVRTDSSGAFLFNNVAPGSAYQLRLMHALLDTLGVSVTTPVFAARPVDTTVIHVGVPAPTRLITAMCPPNLIARGPTALVGFVRDPDTGGTPDSVIISLVYDDSPIDLVKQWVNRVARPDVSGRYIICGLPAGVSGRVQLSRRGLRSAEIPVVASDDSPLLLRTFGVSVATQRGTDVADGGLGLVILRGDARLAGRLVSRAGRPIAGARVQMDGTMSATITGDDGRFVLDSVPSGTQVLSVRKIGYVAMNKPVEVSRQPEPLSIVMDDVVPTLAPVVTTSVRDKDLAEIGFARRKAQGFGFFLEGEQIDKGPPTLGEALRMVPGLHVGYDASSKTGQKAVVMSSRDPRRCLRYVVDGVLWQEVGGDIERFIRPEEIEALEMYNVTSVPSEFSAASRGRCSVLVLWTKQRVRRAKVR